LGNRKSGALDEAYEETLRFLAGNRIADSDLTDAAMTLHDQRPCRLNGGRHEQKAPVTSFHDIASLAEASLFPHRPSGRQMATKAWRCCKGGEAPVPAVEASTLEHLDTHAPNHALGTICGRIKGATFDNSQFDARRAKRRREHAIKSYNSAAGTIVLGGEK
jgi:hypothetical protein